MASSRTAKSYPGRPDGNRSLLHLRNWDEIATTLFFHIYYLFEFCDSQSDLFIVEIKEWGCLHQVSFLFFPILSQDICREPQKILDQAWIYMPDACCRGRNVHAFEDGEYFFRELCPHFQALFSGHGVVFKIYLMLSGFIKPWCCLWKSTFAACWSHGLACEDLPALLWVRQQLLAVKSFSLRIHCTYTVIAILYIRGLSQEKNIDDLCDIQSTPVICSLVKKKLAFRDLQRLLGQSIKFSSPQHIRSQILSISWNHVLLLSLVELFLPPFLPLYVSVIVVDFTPQLPRFVQNIHPQSLDSQPIAIHQCIGW